MRQRSSDALLWRTGLTRTPPLPSPCPVTPPTALSWDAPSFRFLKQPEYLRLGERLLFREGRTKGVGKVARIIPVGSDEEAPRVSARVQAQTGGGAGGSASGAPAAHGLAPPLVPGAPQSSSLPVALVLPASGPTVLGPT